MRFIAQILTNTLAIFLADYLLTGFVIEGDILSFFIAGLVLGLINFFIKPALKMISTPLIIITLGLFTIVINMALLWILQYLIVELTISGLSAYFWSALLISAVNIVFGSYRRKRK